MDSRIVFSTNQEAFYSGIRRMTDYLVPCGPAVSGEWADVENGDEVGYRCLALTRDLPSRAICYCRY
jgi:hypothetical protein